MTLIDAIIAAGMTPPSHIVPGKWVRFPGIGKGKSNRAGWCRLIGPTFAVFGDWSTGISEVWRDDTHRDDAESLRLIKEANARERQFAAEQRKRQSHAAFEARTLITNASMAMHPYLARKGFPMLAGLVLNGTLLIPVRDVHKYHEIISVQSIDENGEKKFLTGSKTCDGVYRLGVPINSARRIVLCEGYATGLSIDAALKRLPGPHSVIVCFSARNMENVADNFPQATVCADNDASGVGERSALATKLPWVMPPEIGDFNDFHLHMGLPAVTEVLRCMPNNACKGML